jgi:lactoylglutathione lyase
MKFLHTMIRVSDIDKSLKFYEELLGLKISRTMDLDDCKLYFLNDGFSNVEIELTHNFETPEGGYDVGTQFGHFAFEVESMDEFTSKMENLGYTYLYEPFELKPGLKIAFVQDPDGSEIELIEASK